MQDEKAGGAEAAETFSEEDLSHVKGDDGAAQDGAGGKGAAEGKEAADAAGADAGGADESAESDDKQPVGGKGKTIAGGADVEADDKAAEDAKAKEKAATPPAWKLNDDVRKAIAEHISAGDKKVYDREMRRLSNIDDVRHLYGNYRELEARLTSGGLIKKPGKDAKPEEIAAYHKALGVPEKPEDYIKDLTLENGAVIGEADKPLLDGFTQALHKAGATPDAVKAALNWYYQRQEATAAEMDEADDTFKRESTAALKDEWGPSFQRRTSAMATLFATAPGGTDGNNPEGLMARMLSARTGDGKILGNDPTFLRWLDYMRNEISPAATLVEDGRQGGLSLDQEIEKIEGIMKTNRREYNAKHADRYVELLAAREKLQARQRAR